VCRCDTSTHNAKFRELLFYIFLHYIDDLYMYLKHENGLYEHNSVYKNTWYIRAGFESQILHLFTLGCELTTPKKHENNRKNIFYHHQHSN
jgi:hypothetical protein